GVILPCHSLAADGTEASETTTMSLFRRLLNRLLGRPPDTPRANAPEVPAEPTGLPMPPNTRASQRRKMPRPADVKPLGANSPMVAFQQANAMVIRDRDAFDYTYGDADGPDPAQRDLDALLPKVTRVCVLEGAMFQGRAMTGKVLFDLSDPGAIRELA